MAVGEGEKIGISDEGLKVLLGDKKNIRKASKIIAKIKPRIILSLKFEARKDGAVGSINIILPIRFVIDKTSLVC